MKVIFTDHFSCPFILVNIQWLPRTLSVPFRTQPTYLKVIFKLAVLKIILAKVGGGGAKTHTGMYETIITGKMYRPISLKNSCE